MRQTIGTLAVATLFALGVSGCEEITEFPEGGVEVRAAHALPAVRTPTIDFTVNVGVDNFTSSLLFVNSACGFVIERLTAGEWTAAYTAPCATGFTQEAQVEPNTTHVFTITAFTNLRVSPDAPAPGTYRVVVPIEAEYSRIRRQTIEPEARTSNAFVVP